MMEWSIGNEKNYLQLLVRMQKKRRDQFSRRKERAPKFRCLTISAFRKREEQTKGKGEAAGSLMNAT